MNLVQDYSERDWVLLRRAYSWQTPKIATNYVQSSSLQIQLPEEPEHLLRPIPGWWLPLEKKRDEFEKVRRCEEIEHLSVNRMTYSYVRTQDKPLL